MADLETEKESYSGFERLMFILTPILFAVVMLGVLIILFNGDIRNQVLHYGNKVPLLKELLPDEKSTGSAATDDNKIRSENMGRKIADLQAQLTEKENELASTANLKTQQEQEIKKLETEIEQLNQSNAKKALENEEYDAKIQELASMYGKITPSKAAPILQAMTLEDMVLVLEAMRPDDRVRVMEKMNPKIAADATVQLKDTKSAKDRQIAALQAEKKKLLAATTKEKDQSALLDNDQLSATFKAMDAKSAGKLLVSMAEVSPSKVHRILNAVDNTTRSAILAEMSTVNEKLTAKIISNLMPGK
ncbi:MgtE protein [Paenibacillus sp. NPDC058071]|uniref:MgtE protein n=1 Tax=Paenibacillus sp. NPDC058071 TaxID=3346326 RepID=UPI0036DE8E9E